MPKKPNKSAKGSDAAENPRLRGYIIWAIAAGAWLLIAAALVSYHPADWPSHQVWPNNPRPQNWIGRFGAVIAYQLYLMFGPGVWISLTGGLALLIAAARGRKVNQLILRSVGVILMSITASAMIGLMAPTALSDLPRSEGAGGLLALFINHELVDRFNTPGTMIVLLVAFWVGAILAVDHLVLSMSRRLGQWISTAKNQIQVPRPVLVGRLAWLGGISGGSSASAIAAESAVALRGRNRRPVDGDADEPIDEDTLASPAVAVMEPLARKENSHAITEDEEDDDPVRAVAEDDEEEDLEHDAPAAYVAEKKPFDPEALRDKIRTMPINFAPKVGGKIAPGLPMGGASEMDLSGYRFPGLDLLEEPEGTFTQEMEAIVREQGVALESAMQEYRIDGTVVGIDSGPVITLYEVKLAPGTKVSRLSAVASDLARALKAHSIRIVTNIAGKDTIGVEVPNIKKEKVRLKELMTASTEATAKMKLPMFLGKDASGNPLIADLTQMPHMLIAGTTGSGKSVCMNSIIMSFLFTKRPNELKLVLVDPKMVEMSLFREIPHLMCPVVTEMNKAAAILEWAVTKMDERYELLAEVGVRDIAGYNNLTWDEIRERINPAHEAEEARIPRKLPYMVFIIDELADLMMTNNEVESFIVRIAQKARAVGIHLILATQRPQANVVTGLIKSNMPCRVSFQVASGMDSRIVLDSKGAETLLGQGDMLYLSPRTSKLTRSQGTFVEDVEIRRTVKFLKDISQQNFEPQLVQIKAPGMSEEGSGERDPLFDDAVAVVLESQRGSVSLLQRRLTIGYSRASRLIEQMGEAGIIGEYKGSQAREVNITLEEWEALKAQAAADANADAEAAKGTIFAKDEPEEESFGADDDNDDDDDGVPDELPGEHRQ